MFGVAFGVASCTNDLNISSIDPQTSPSFDQSSAFVKEYALLGVTGQKVLPDLPTWMVRMKVNRVSSVPYSTAMNFALMNVYGLGKTM